MIQVPDRSQEGQETRPKKLKNMSNTGNKSTKKMISGVVDSTLYQLSVSDNKSDGEDNKNSSQAYSANADKKARFKSILKKSRINLPIRVYGIYLLRLT